MIDTAPSGTLSDAWISTVCRRFTETTGWPLEFVPDGRGLTPPAARAASVEHASWNAAIYRGRETAGAMRLDVPAPAANERAIRAATELADLLAELVNRALGVSARLDARTRQLATLIDIGLSLAGEHRLLRALEQLLRGLVLLTERDAAAFFLLDPATNELNLRVWSGIERQNVPAARRSLTTDPPDLNVLAHGRDWLNARSNASDGRWLPPGMSHGHGVCVATSDGPLGTLWVFGGETGSRQEALVLDSIASQVAAVLERTVLRVESEDGQRLRNDLRVASAFQNVGATAPDWLDLACSCTSRYELGGDLCEVVPLGPERILLAVGDASGDSVPAAMVMSAARGALHTFCGSFAGLLQDSPPATDQLVARLNESLCHVTPAHQFMSLWIGVLDAREHALTWTNAGHPGPVVVRADACEVLEPHGLLLGILPEAAYGRSTTFLTARDALVVFSDGVTEQMNSQRELFGVERLIETVRDAGAAGGLPAGAGDGQARDRWPAASAEVLVRSVLDRLARHATGDHKPDDRTLLVARLRAAQR